MSKTITVTATKEAVDSKIGLSLNYYDGGKIIIRHIFEDGLFANTDLKTGCVLVSVNGKDVKGMSTAQTMNLFVEAEGDVVVVADDVGLRIASFTKSSGDKQVGLGLRQRDGHIMISTILEDSILANTDIKVGHRLLGVNGVCCKGLTAPQAIDLFRQLDSVTVLAQDIGHICVTVKVPLAVGLIPVTVNRESPDIKIGIGLKQLDGDIIVSTISPDGLFAGTALKQGHRLVRIGKSDVKSLTKNEAIKLFKNAEGSLRVVAEDIGLIMATVVKESAEDKIGVGLKSMGGDIIISTISADSLFANTEIQIGMRLVCVNSTMVRGLSPTAAIDLFKKATGEITVTAEKIGLIMATVVKESVEDKIGVGLKSIEGDIIISTISADSLFASTELQTGMRLVSVNSTMVRGLSATEAIDLFKKATGKINVMAEKIDVVTATAAPKIGIGLKQFGGNIIVSTISPDGLFAGTALKAGHRLLCIGKTDVKGLTKNEAIRLFKTSEESLTVLADDIGLITVTVVKESPEDKIGVGLKSMDGDIIISTISPDSLFANTELQTGLRLVSVNSTVVRGLSTAASIALFKNATGEITVMAEKIGFVTVTATKESADSLVGIGLKEVNGNIVISSISANGVFANTELKIGLKLVSVNKVSCAGLDKKAAIKLFQDAEGEITVMAQDIGLIGVTVMKDSANAKLGIGLKEVNGVVRISSIYASGLFNETDLTEDLELVSVNRTSIKGLNKNQAIDLFKNAEGELTVLAKASS